MEMSVDKCRTCQEVLDSTWLFCEYCGKKTNKSDRDLEISVQQEITRKAAEDVKMKLRIHQQSAKLERVPACDVLMNRKPEQDPKLTLIKARAQAANESLSQLKAPVKHRKKNISVSSSIVNETDMQTEKMISFLEEFNHSTMKKTSMLSSLPNKSTFSFSKTKASRGGGERGEKKKNKNAADFFSSELDIRTSQNFNEITSSDNYLNHIPSLLDIFDNPSLMQKDEYIRINESDRTDPETRPSTSTLAAKEQEDNNAAAIDKDENENRQPEVFFWGHVAQLDEEGGEQNDKEEHEEKQSSSLEAAVKEMRLFKGGFWGDTSEEGRELQLEEEQKDVDILLSDEDDPKEEDQQNIDETASGPGEVNEEDKEDDESQVVDYSAVTQTTAPSEIFERLQIDVTAFRNENGRRYIANLYRSSMKHMNKAISKGTIVFSKDPVNQSRPVTLYSRLERLLQNTINEAELCIRAIDELYRMCHEDSKQRRVDIVARLDTETKRAAAVRHKYSVKYAKITNKEGVDVYTLELAQNKIREKAEKELDAVRIVVNELLREETELIMKIKSEERSLELTVVMYSTKHLRLLEQTRVTHQSIISAKKWLAVRVIQRNVRFYLLPGSTFTLANVATPWFRQLLRRQTEMLRQESYKNPSQAKSKKKKYVPVPAKVGR